MGKKLVVSFPGGRGYEVPLLYFSSKHFEDHGYDKLFINHPVAEEKDFEAIYENAESILKSVNYTEYDTIVFLAKSMGATVACKLKEAYQIPASLVLFTPLQEVLPHINQNNDILFVTTGENDRHLDSNIVKELCIKENIAYYIEPNVGHRMEVKEDLERNLEILRNVLGQLKKVTNKLWL